MSALPIAARLLRAAQQAYDIVTPGPLATRAPFREIGWLAEPQAFTSGALRIDAALVGETASEAIIAFRGTLPFTTASPDKKQVLLDWLSDLDALRVADPNLPGLVHQGFLTALNALWPSVLAALPTGKPVYVTGHSKGGAMANLAAARLAPLFPAPPLVVTFAAAKPGDAAFQTAYETLVPHSVRYEYQDDIVPHLPPSLEFAAMFRNLPLLADAMTASAGRPLSSGGYVGVGELQFIDWRGAIVGDSPTLRFRRYASLAEKIVALQASLIVADHTIGDDGGYARAILPAATAQAVAQAVPGVSALV